MVNTTKKLLTIKNLYVRLRGKKEPILRGVNLKIGRRDVHAFMGPNGSGKSTLAYAIMGYPKYEVSSGSIHFDGIDIVNMPVDKRAKLGIFLGFQYPYDIEGVPLRDLLRQSYNALYRDTDKQLSVEDFSTLLEEKCALLEISPDFLDRSINVGFSGGEKKRAEVLQLAVLQPKFAILDEIDSGLDIDALQVVCRGIEKIRQDNPEIALLIITHYPRILQFQIPDVVSIMDEGRIVRSGGSELAAEIERNGYSASKGIT
jgi:Fe-S cluster assembly ATP-binding protein